MTSEFNTIEFEVVECSRQDFHRIKQRACESLDHEFKKFNPKLSSEEWHDLHNQIQPRLSKYWVEDYFGLEDFALTMPGNTNSHFHGTLYKPRIVCREFVQLIMDGLAQVQTHFSWYFCFLCEIASLPGEFLVVGNKVFVTGDPDLSVHLKKKKIKPDSLHRSVELDNMKWVEHMYKPSLFYTPTLRDDKGNFPQHYIKSTDVADFLHERGFDFNLRNAENFTALDKILDTEPWLYDKKDFKKTLAKHLIDLGAKTSFEIDFPLHFHALLGTEDSLLQQLKSHNIAELDHYLHEPPLMYALRSGDTGKIKLLLNHGANIKQRTADGDCILTTAYHCRSELSIIQLLLDYGADTNSRCPSHDNSPVLHLYCRNFSVDAVKLLIDYGAHLNARDAHGRTAAFYATGKDAITTLQLLHKRGLHLLATDRSGETCIDYILSQVENKAIDSPERQKLLDLALKLQKLLENELKLNRL